MRYVALLGLALVVGCKPSVTEFNDKLDKMTAEEAAANSRDELVKKIGREPDWVEVITNRLEKWKWDLGGGSTSRFIIREDGKFYALVGENEGKFEIAEELVKGFDQGYRP